MNTGPLAPMLTDRGCVVLDQPQRDEPQTRYNKSGAGTTGDALRLVLPHTAALRCGSAPSAKSADVPG